MDGEEERLNELLKTKELVNDVITLRTEMPAIFGKYLKKAYIMECKSLMKMEIEIPTQKLSLTEFKKIDFNKCKTTPCDDIDNMQKELNNLKTAFSFIR